MKASNLEAPIAAFLNCLLHKCYILTDSPYDKNRGNYTAWTDLFIFVKTMMKQTESTLLLIFIFTLELKHADMSPADTNPQ